MLNRSKFQTCPNCQELTVEYTLNTIEVPTQTKEDKYLVTAKCHCCSYFDEKIETIPRTSSYYSDGSSTYSSGGSSDSGSFGGGASGGDGGGGSW